MTVFDRIKLLADQRKINLQTVATDLGFSENYIYGLKNKKSPSAKHLEKIASYFHTSVDYLLGVKSQPYGEQDLKPILIYATNYDNTPVTESDRIFLIDFMEIYFDRINHE